ncbi:MAG: RNA methyltransferase [Saprospiraceae bacterium]|nr:RNA methyltransferase [Saprospiraceae bacterium]
MNERRAEKIKTVVEKRQKDFTIVLENIRDHHNIGAALRSCDSVGIQEIFVLQSDPALQTSNVVLGKRTSAGTRKWVDTHYFTNTAACFAAIRTKYEFIFTTHLEEQSKSLYQLDLTQSIALFFGNEEKGVSEEALQLADGNFIIPQMGMAASLNVSVACAVAVYEGFRQRYLKGFYDNQPQLTLLEQASLIETYTERHLQKQQRKKSARLD